MDLIFVSMEDWDDIWRRNQFVCAGLARRFPEMKILFVGLNVDISNQLRRGKLGDLRSPAVTALPDLPNIMFMKPVKLLPNSLPSARRWNERHMRAQVRRAARRAGIESPLLWLNPHSAVHMIGTMNERGVLYDITDDWTTLAQSAALTKLVIDQDAEMCRRADAVVVCSQRLFDMKRRQARNLHLIPNGVDSSHYRCVLDDTSPLPEETRAWPKPVFGYIGTIHPDRVDVELVEAIGRQLTAGSIVLIGPNMLSRGDSARLVAAGSVILAGQAPYSRLPQLMRAFDVSITPHRMTPFTESLNPIKLWEYLAAGKPIVATDIAGFRDYPKHVRLASNAASFHLAMLEALGEPAADREARRNAAAGHSWNTRVDDIVAVINSVAHG